jgi:hypothetical protein
MNVVMEDPQTWDRITASLAQFLPDEPDELWEFLLAEGFVRNDDREAFVEVINATDLADITAVATALGEASLLSGEAFDDDPAGAIAIERASAWRAER